MDSSTPSRPTRIAFLLAQVGALASTRFTERTRDIGLTPSDAGVLRLLDRAPGLSQRALADRLGAVPSRVVPLIDSLQDRGLVERERSSTDRRTYELRLSAEGRRVLHQLQGIAEAHEAELLASLTDGQRAQLRDLLAQLVAANGLDADLHRGTGGAA
ncbi:MAG: putative transcriptional regulatory protein for hcr operon [Micrococcaceae bacterium]|nr:putative transcriptional regulatory protein for hcr operon [Micrococcaceae bacterium]